MPDQHAKLSPSASERWIACPASVRMELEVPKQAESSYALEGTIAHALAEIKASFAFGIIDHAVLIRRRAAWQQKYAKHLTPEIEVEMEEHTDSYVAIIQERAQRYPFTTVMFEQRLDTGVPACWGTSDAVLVSPQHIEIVDFKYGSGVAVEAHGNSQLRLYGVGALERYGDVLGETEVVYITVHQPRMEHLLTEEITPQALREWRDSIIPVAEEALGDDAHFGPSETACRWCPASGRCRAQLEDVFSVDFYQEPKLLSEAEIADSLGKVRHVLAWVAAVEEASLAMAYSEGKSIPGYKVVLSGGKRSVVDPDGAITLLEAEGYDFEDIGVRKAKGIGDLEKLLGREKFKTLLEETGYVRKGEGKPSLVPESDKRAAINPNAAAAQEFKED